ncbi:hypothetical protein ACWF9G_30110 [Nocardia sp. NPDC055029]
MTSGDLDALAIAREQIRHLLADGGQHLNDPQFRLQLGLLASQIALAERLPGGLPEERPVPLPSSPEVEWNLPTIKNFLERLPGIGMKTVRILVAEGGSATPARIKELTGAKGLSGLKSAQQYATRSMTRPLPHGWLIEQKYLDNRRENATERYFIRANLLPLVGEALDQIDKENS